MMASAWGSSWGSSWGNAWGSISAPQNAITRVTTTVRKTGASVSKHRVTATNIAREAVTASGDIDAPTRRH